MNARTRAPRRSLALLCVLSLASPFALGGCRVARARESYSEMDKRIDELTNRVTRLEAQVEGLQRAKQ